MLELHAVNHLCVGILHKVRGGALVPHVDRLGGLDVALDEVVVRGIENGGGGVQVDKRAVLLVIPAAVGQFPVFAGAWGDLPLGIGVYAEPAQPVGAGLSLLDIRVDHGVGRSAEITAQVLEVAARFLRVAVGHGEALPCVAGVSSFEAEHGLLQNQHMCAVVGGGERRVAAREAVADDHDVVFGIPCNAVDECGCALVGAGGSGGRSCHGRRCGCAGDKVAA